MAQKRHQKCFQTFTNIREQLQLGNIYCTVKIKPHLTYFRIRPFETHCCRGHELDWGGHHSHTTTQTTVSHIYCQKNKSSNISWWSDTMNSIILTVPLSAQALTYLLCQPWSRLVYFFRTPSRCRLLRVVLLWERPDTTPLSLVLDPSRCWAVSRLCSCRLQGLQAGLSWCVDRFMLLRLVLVAVLDSVPQRGENDFQQQRARGARVSVEYLMQVFGKVMQR